MKIIISNKTKIHMKIHKDDFLINWCELIEKCNDNNVFNNLNKDFEIKTIEFDEDIGYSSLVTVTEDDDIVYAKRKGRSTYTKFVRNKKKELVKSVVFILKRRRRNKDQYYLITMFPGVGNYKEPEDINIKNERELKDSLEFWCNHALVFDEEIIKVDSLESECPYKKLYSDMP